jgi:hypothetical protein
LLDADGGDDPFVAIRRRARALVARALELEWVGPPFDMTELASLQGLEVSTSTAFADDQDACVVPGRVLVNARKHRVRQRYSVAHEVGHTLFPDYEEELRREGRLWRREGDESEFEQLCQAAGAELLMPLGAFRTEAESRGRTLEGVMLLAGDFEASLEATTRRMIETADSPMAALFLRPRDPTTGKWLEVSPTDGHFARAALGVSLVCASRTSDALAGAKGSSPPRGSAAERAWKRATLARGAVVVHRRTQESWEHLGIAGTWDSEAMTLPKGAALPHEVLCITRRTSS